MTWMDKNLCTLKGTNSKQSFFFFFLTEVAENAGVILKTALSTVSYMMWDEPGP